MIDPKNLILLDIEEAEIALTRALRGELDVYIIDTNRNMPFLLTLGHLESIRMAIPRRTEIILGFPSPRTGISSFERAGYEDLRILESNYDDIFNKNQKEDFETEKEINETERSSLYKMILGMAVKKYAYKHEAHRNSATGSNNGSIKADLDACGLYLDDETIRTYLQKASEMHLKNE